MKVAGEAVLNAPVEKVWNALLDPQVLVRTIPGCERLETTGDNAYAMTITAGVASIKGTYAGTCELSDLRPHESLVMRAAGSGAPGTVSADVAVGFADAGDGTTRLTYAADAVVGGMVGGVGQRMLTSVSKRMAGEFFGSVDDVLNGATPVEASEAGEPTPPVAGQTFTAPVRTVVGAPDEFIKGVLLGAGLVLAGVVVGGLFGRRRG
ncbi:SRPBCC family protein [Solicola gregarius]|uniref:Carbon monoxide dehydrogenase subunit G n=1 Tax=Solicola gregarius TaxID=2908642 RepID=A0AA46TIT6_9ACTN|nr:carbon monoxide dehydrogenase subunit G [Solicola gregarius]UYM06127.1 carbon monoxide dehydrogenase subunit G [Solicola gregarius]